MFETINIIAEAGADAPAGSIFGGFMPMLLIFGAMWFLLIAPQRKKQKQHAAMLQALSNGDQVITNGGIYGTITQADEEKLTLKIAEGTKIEVSRAFIQSKVEKEDK